MDWFLYDNGPRHERVKLLVTISLITIFVSRLLYISNRFRRNRPSTAKFIKQLSGFSAYTISNCAKLEKVKLENQNWLSCKNPFRANVSVLIPRDCIRKLQVNLFLGAWKGDMDLEWVTRQPQIIACKLLLHICPHGKHFVVPYICIASIYLIKFDSHLEATFHLNNLQNLNSFEGMNRLKCLYIVLFSRS